MIEASGHNGQVVFDGIYVTIRRAGLFARATVGRGEKRISIAQLVAVQWKPATSLFTGFVQFETAGPGGTRSKFGRQTRDALGDENTVVFYKRSLGAFSRLRDEVEKAIAARTAAGVVVPAASLSDDLGRLGQMYQQGLLSPQEFDAAKARLLRR